MEQALFVTRSGARGIELAYDAQTRAELSNTLEFLPLVDSVEALMENRARYADAKYIFSTWGMLPLTLEQIREALPQLRAVFYAAGTVQDFVRPFLDAGAEVFSAWGANGVPVAEFAVSQIILANKGFFQANRRYKSEGYTKALAYCQSFPGNYGTRVGLLGAGMIGRLVIRLLEQNTALCPVVFDPFLSDADAAALGVEKADLDTIFSTCQTISNHLANNEQTKGMLTYAHFSRMLPNATFINTGRGAQLIEADLVRALQDEPGRTAVLDVTFPEPIPENSPFIAQENVVLTPHVAGSQSCEIARMGRYMFEEYTSFSQGKPTRYCVTREMLSTMA